MSSNELVARVFPCEDCGTDVRAFVVGDGSIEGAWADEVVHYLCKGCWKKRGYPACVENN